jgi:hypothetical protein
MNQKKIIKLTALDGQAILIGVESIIDVRPQTMQTGVIASRIRSRGGMVETNIAIESIEQIWELINDI